MGAIAGVFVVILGMGWTVLAYTFTRGMPVVGLVFPLFGVMFVGMGILNIVYNFRNATARNRFSIFEVTSGNEEPDPLALGGQGGAPSVESRLQQLEALRARGLVRPEEYERKRADILTTL